MTAPALVVTMTLECRHVITLTGRLTNEALTRTGRPIYCAECRRNRVLISYDERTTT